MSYLSMQPSTYALSSFPYVCSIFEALETEPFLLDSNLWEKFPSVAWEHFFELAVISLTPSEIVALCSFWLVARIEASFDAFVMALLIAVLLE